nr:glycosyltransferase family 2 protein [uncultured Flavobacterium sp.]
MPKLTIITINYNNLEGLKRTVESIVNQTWQEFEYIVIDGGSIDGSAAYIENQSENIDYWVSEPDKGIYNAMNKGIVKATGEYLLFLNSGDHFLDSEVLDKNHKFLTLQDIVYFNLQVVDENEKFVKNYPDKLSFSYFLKDTLPHPATFIKKAVFDKLGLYDESLKIVSDWKFFMESVCKFNCSYKKIDETLSVFYLDGLSSDYKNKNMISEESQKVLQSSFKAFIQDSNELIELKTIISDLRISRRIKILVKLGLINKF